MGKAMCSILGQAPDLTHKH